MTKTTVKKKSNAGRKTKYFTHIEPNLETIRLLRQKGDTEENIAKRFGVAVSTWNEYKLKYPEFKAVTRECAEYVYLKTQESLYNTAWGWTVPQLKETWELDARTGKMILVKKEILPDKVIVGNVIAQKFILTNRGKGDWVDRNITDTTVSGNVEQLEIIAETLKLIGSKGIDQSQFEDSDEDDEQ